MEIGGEELVAELGAEEYSGLRMGTVAEYST